MARWVRILKQEHVVAALTSTRKFDALRELTAVLEDVAAIDNHEQFLADLIRREKQSSTGIGKGVAVPHVHEDSISKEVLAVGISKEGIDFDSVDGESRPHRGVAGDTVETSEETHGTARFVVADASGRGNTIRARSRRGCSCNRSHFRAPVRLRLFGLSRCSATK